MAAGTLSAALVGGKLGVDERLWATIQRQSACVGRETRVRHGLVANDDAPRRFRRAAL
jgi:hypothetical protein